MRLHKYLQLPLCPSCLERLDPTISNVWPHYCDEVECSSFYNQITNVTQSIPSKSNQIEKEAIFKYETIKND